MRQPPRGHSLKVLCPVLLASAVVATALFLPACSGTSEPGQPGGGAPLPGPGVPDLRAAGLRFLDGMRLRPGDLPGFHCTRREGVGLHMQHEGGGSSGAFTYHEVYAKALGAQWFEVRYTVVPDPATCLASLQTTVRNRPFRMTVSTDVPVGYEGYDGQRWHVVFARGCGLIAMAAEDQQLVRSTARLLDQRLAAGGQPGGVGRRSCCGRWSVCGSFYPRSLLRPA
jgi:hypothetical protein